MKKAIIFGTIVLTAVLLVSGLWYPNYPLMWLASSSINYEIIRAGLIVVLAILFFSNPPRAIFFRVFLAICALGLGVSTITMLGTYEMNLIDAIVFMEIAIIFALEALEAQTNYGSLTSMNRQSGATS